MADQFFQMTQRNVENTAWDNLFPLSKIEIAGGTATAITVTIPNLVDGVCKTFVASASNSGSATTINGKSLYKPNTTTAPTLIAGKAYTVWYSASNDCFFIKASAEGDAVAGDVLAGKTGFTDAAGQSLAIVAEKDNAHPVIAVLLGSSDRFGDMNNLLNWTFWAYDWKESK